VALLYKKNDILFVYESTAKDGCMLRTWREFTHFLWNLLYDKMVYRELKVNMEDKQKKKFLDEIETNCDLFIKETQRKRYYLNCLNFFCGKKKEYENKNDWAQADGFFCSQLVAAAYLKCNILKNKNGAGAFFPGSFADIQGNELELYDNFEFGPENIIEFSE